MMCAQKSGHEGDEAPSSTMLRHIYGFWVSRALYVAAKLGIPDLLQDQAKSAVELAEATDMHADSLRRVLRVLVSIGAFTEDDQGRFALTLLGATLRSGVPNSLHALALLHLDEVHFDAWGDILHSVKTGDSAFNHLVGMGVWQYRTLHSEHAKNFDEAMANMVSIVNQAILIAYDFSSFGKMVDVGGGNGSLLISLLKANPEMTGIVFDMPYVAEGANERIAAAGLLDRCEFAAGDFFTSIPSGADAYLLSRVIHDWDDTHSIAILMNCRRVIPLESKLLLVERVVPAQAEQMTTTQLPTPFLSDLNMLVITGGRERTEAEYRALFEAANFRLTKIVPTRSSLSIIEAAPA
jgi:hypothetical protein